MSTLRWKFLVLRAILHHICLFIWYNQRLIVYPFGFAFLHSQWQRVKAPRVPYEITEVITRDKVKLRCLLIPHVSSTSLRGTVILFHGNCMNHGDVIDPHAVILSNLGFTVFAAEYRGYGQSEGTPSESGLQLDAQAALDFVASHPELSKSPVVICGHSLGGAVAIDVTSRNADKVSALIIENTFTSIPSLVRRWPMGRFLSLFTTQKWYSSSKIARIPPSLPILMLSGLRDTVVPSSEMAELWEVAKTRGPKKNTGWFRSALWWEDREVEEEHLLTPENDVFETFHYGDHNGMFLQAEYMTKVIAFLDNVVPSASIPSSSAL